MDPLVCGWWWVPIFWIGTHRWWWVLWFAMGSNFLVFGFFGFLAQDIQSGTCRHCFFLLLEWCCYVRRTMARTGKVGGAFAVCTALVLVIATASRNWRFYELCVGPNCVSIAGGLFTACVSATGQDTQCQDYGSDVDDWIRACQAFAVIACLITIPAAFYLLFAAFRGTASARVGKILTGLLAVAVVAAFLAWIIFAANGFENDGINMGWGMWFMIIASVFLIIVTFHSYVSQVRRAGVTLISDS